MQLKLVVIQKKEKNLYIDLISINVQSISFNKIKKIDVEIDHTIYGLSVLLYFHWSIISQFIVVNIKAAD